MEPHLSIIAINYQPIIIYAVIIVVLLVLSAFFSMSETVYSSVSSAKLMTSIAKNKKGARKALWLSENFDKVLSVILIMNNLVNIAISTLGLRIFLILFENLENSGWVDVINTLVITLFVLIFGEILPKTKGKAKNETLALRYSGILFVVVKILTPLAWPFYKMNRLALKNIEEDNSVSLGDLENIIIRMEDEGDIKEDAAEMIGKVLDLSTIDVKSIMTPRVDVVAIDVESSADEIKKCFFENQYSRVPVYEDTIDNIIGVLYEKEFFKALVQSPKSINIKKLLTKPLVVVGSMHADSLLTYLKKANVHLAVVIDEYGGFDGIVTMEDALEELVGEIFDEHDDVPFRIKKIDENHYEVNGDLEIEALFEELEIDERSEETEATTVGGWVQDSLQRVPQTGDTVTYKVMAKVIYDEISQDDGIDYKFFIFKVLSIKKNRITKLSLEIIDYDENLDQKEE